MLAEGVPQVLRCVLVALGVVLFPQYGLPVFVIGQVNFPQHSSFILPDVPPSSFLLLVVSFLFIMSLLTPLFLSFALSPRVVSILPWLCESVLCLLCCAHIF